MTSTNDLHALPLTRDLPTTPASELKNAFKPVFQRVLREGAVSITRNRRREAILLSAELYDRMIAELALRDPLAVLRRDYDERFASMQGGDARRACEAAFDATPGELGEAAVEQAGRK